MYIKTLTMVANRYAPSRPLSFDVVHVFKALQLIENRGHISRALLCRELALGEGSIKTLVKHLKMNNLVRTDNSGTKMTNKGKGITSQIISSIPRETSLPKCSIALGSFNQAVLLKGLGYAIKSGIEQRDAAIKIGGIGATTLLFKDNKFVMPTSSQDSLKKEPEIRRILVETLRPEEGDAIIIGSSDSDMITADLSAKNAALLTIVAHENHA